VQSPAGIQWVNLQYRGVNQEQAYTALPMEATAEKNVYRATIPADALNGRFNFMYFFEIMDKQQAGSIYPDVNKATPYYIIKLSGTR